MRIGQPSPTPLPRVRASGLDLAYREWNRGGSEPVVLLHGITSSSSAWEATASHLGGRRVLAVDARGHGESDWDPGEAYGGDQHFADVASLLNALGIERCTLVGFSMGGGIAMLAAACLPERVSGLVVVDSYPSPEMTPGSRRIAGWVSSYNGGSRFDPAIARHFRDQLQTGRESRLDLWPMWEAISCPALLVRGERSDVLPVAMAEEMIARQPLARLLTIPDVGHPIPLMRPAELAEAIAEFVDQR